MIAGILLAIAAGIIWSLSGVANSSCARYRLDITSYLFANVFFSFIFTALFLVQFDQLRPDDCRRLAVILIPAGILNTGGALFLQHALQKGHHGIVFLISQSALVVPFLFGIFIMGEPTSLTRCLGAALILAGMTFCALPRIQLQVLPEALRQRWLSLTLLSFACFGLAQSLMSLPSYWRDFQDAASIRTSLIYLGSTLCMTGYALGSSTRRKLHFNKPLIFCGILVAILNCLSMSIMFKALDRLSRCGMASIGFSLAIAASLLAFTLYSLLVLREKCYPLTLLGLLAILTGGILIT